MSILSLYYTDRLKKTQHLDSSLSVCLEKEGRAIILIVSK